MHKSNKVLGADGGVWSHSCPILNGKLNQRINYKVQFNSQKRTSARYLRMKFICNQITLLS